MLHIELPSLQERRGDVQEIARHVLKAFVAEYRLRADIMPEVMLMLAPLFANYAWPGNVRELANLLTRAAIHFDELQRGSREDLLAVFPELAEAGLQQRAVSKPLPDEPLTPDVAHRTLSACGGNRSAAAKQLGISRTTMWWLLKEVS